MRAFVLAGAAAGFVVLCGLVIAGGNALDEPTVVIDMEDLPTEIPGAPDADSAADTEARDVGASDKLAAAPEQTNATPEPGIDPNTGLQRIAPREPLSKLSQALPPKPKMPDEWKGTILHRAVGLSAGLIEAAGYTVAIAGTDLIAVNRNCTYEGKDWDCGVYARTAFRAFLRGRSPTCVVPPEPDREIVMAECRVGKQDIGEWLVSNGWARAVEGGPYAEVEAKAREAKAGVFGPPPSKGGLPNLPSANLPLSATVQGEDIQILVPDSAEPASEETTGATPPIDLTAPFPPAPASP